MNCQRGDIAEPVLFFGPARTGSSFIVNTLRSHPQVMAHGEPFQTENLQWHFDPLILPLVDFDFRERSPYQFIRWIYRQSCGRFHVVLKILFGQNDATLLRLLRDTDVRLVYLRRPNRLAHFASMGLAYQTNVWNAHRGEIVDQNAQIDFELKEFEKFFRWLNRCESSVESIFMETGRKFFECNYDPLRLGASARNVAEWLGIDPFGVVDSTMVRVRESRVLDKFSNPDAVLDTLKKMNRLDWVEE